MGWRGLIACGVLQILLMAALAWLGDLRNGGVVGFEVLQFAAAGTYLVALACVRQAEGRASPRWLLWFVVITAIAMRVPGLLGEPSLSTDFYRYAWEGRVQLEGVNPYFTPPSDPELSHLRDGLYLKVNHPEISAIYGPALQMLFLLGAALSTTLLPLKGIFLLADLGLMVLFQRLANRRGFSPLWLVLYAWHPLVLTEVAGQGHLEVVPIALMLWAVDLYETDRFSWAALLLGFAVAAKYLPILLLPAFLRAAPSWRARIGRLILVALPGVVLTLPYLAAASQLGSGLAAYAQSWRFNDGGFWLIDQALRKTGLSQEFCRQVLPSWPGIEIPPGFDPAEHTTWMLILPKLVVVGLVLLASLVITRPRQGWIDLARAACWVGALFLIFSPVVHPWYTLWVVPFLLVGPARVAFLYLSLITPLAYLVLLGYDGSGASWQEEPWVRLAQYAPFALLWLLPGRQRMPFISNED